MANRDSCKEDVRGPKPRPRCGDEVRVVIESLAQGGQGVGRVDGFVFFVPLAAPREEVLARVSKVRRSHGQAHLLEVVEPSFDRVEPRCRYFGDCGGCAWQHIDYSAQLLAKQKLVKDAFEHLAARTGPLPHAPIISSEASLGYRNKMEFSFHPTETLGLHRRGFFDQVVEVDECLLPSPSTSRILRAVKAFVRENGLRPWSAKTNFGLLRHLVIRESWGTGEIMVGLVTSSDSMPAAGELAAHLLEVEPRIASIVRAITDSPADAVAVESLQVLHGRDHIFETLGGVRFRVGLETFFQTNTPQAERMVTLVRELAALTGTESVLDLFCGVGTFALLLAPHARRVFGLEVVPGSIEAARETASREGIENAEFMVGDARRGLPNLLAEMGEAPDVLVLDPPRSGAGGKVMRRIGRSRARRVIYVSCNPATLAPDLDWLVPFGYDVKAVQPIDLFPQTHHVETIVRLDRRQDADEIPDPFRTPRTPAASP